MVGKDENVKAAWSEVDVQLQRRADLIPNLVETVKGFTKEESTVFGDIANARAGLLNAHDPQGKDRRPTDSSIRPSDGCSPLTENYPQLRSSEQFMRLQDELSGTENRISVARKRYNDTIQDYNTFILQFPNSIWAGMAGFQQNDAYFEASAASQHRAQREVLDGSQTINAKRPSRLAGWPFAVLRSCESVRPAT